jgi:hypothetical protein
MRCFRRLGLIPWIAIWLALAPVASVEARTSSDIKQAYSTVQTFTVTNLHSLASSQTAGWQSAIVDNTSNLYQDALVQVVLDFANTAPANDKAAYVYVCAGIESGTYSDPCSGSEGTITLTNVGSTGQNVRLIGVLAYETADAVIESSPMSVAAAFGGTLPPYWKVVIINYSGAALAGSGNTVKWVGKYATVS